MGKRLLRINAVYPIEGESEFIFYKSCDHGDYFVYRDEIERKLGDKAHH